MAAAIPARTSEHNETTESIWFLDSLVEVRASREEHPVSVVEMTVPADDASPLHLQDEDEWVHVLEGSVTFHVGADVVRARAGDSVFMPSGRLHTHVASGSGARWLVVTESGRFEKFVRAVGRDAPAPILPPRSGRLTHEDAEDVTRAGLEHGIEYFGPPGMSPTEL